VDPRWRDGHNPPSSERGISVTTICSPSPTWAVISTVLSGVTIYVVGQLIVKLAIEPVQDARKTIAQISHCLIEHGDVIHNPGVPTKEKSIEVSQTLRMLSAQLHSHLFLVPCYRVTAFAFRLPARGKILKAAEHLTGLSSAIFSKSDDIYEEIAKRQAVICDSLGIYFPVDQRWPAE
jgi:hypothetical protein